MALSLSAWAASAAPPRARLDPALQAATRRLLAEARPVLGGIVALHVPTGRVLAWQEFQRSGRDDHPNTRAMTPAASLFKIVTTVALFERAHVQPLTPVCISGGERGIERFHLMPPPAGERDVLCRPFEEALGFSRNAVFAQLATERLLRRDLIEVAERLGFNQPLASDEPAEMGALEVPYNDLEFARTAAGFRGSRLSVLGAARLALLIANGGKEKRIRFDHEATDDSIALEPASDPPMQPRTAQRLRRMLEFTVHSGTSLEAFSDPDGRSYLGGIRVAGKTGTLRPNVDGPTTSWFTGFAPSRAPELVVSVMLDNSPVWRRKANHVARDVFRAYFHAAPGVTHPFENGGG
ncbi:MAG TPA: penicillin-binding transpeptidase domain-containing protein [Polyangiaceae bacterium]|nr:penicillin-binding transpeptidase domain-containing protein [Polyangiaceae bacterium]